MHNLEENFMIILSIVKHCLHNILDSNGNVPKRGPAPRFSDAKVIALGLFAETQGIDSESYLFSLMSSFSSFKNQIERSRYNRRRRYLQKLVEELRLSLVRQMVGNENVFLIDSMPLEICKFSRAKRLRICKENYGTAPSFGGCVAQLKTYFGYKLHSVTTLSGVITHFAITKASVADIHFLRQIKPYYPGCLLLGDRGYLSNPLQQELFEEHKILLNTPMRRNQINYSLQPPVFRKARKRIETIFSQLHGQFNAQINYAKTFQGFMTRIHAKITALTLSQFVNLEFNKPMNHIKYAFLN
jgi:hypothetical protein